MPPQKRAHNDNRQLVTKGMRDIRDKLRGMAHCLKDATPESQASLLTPERVINIVLSSAGKPGNKLHLCSMTSVAQSVTSALSLGLEPNGPLGHCYLVPYNSKSGHVCQLVIGYRGFIMLARRSGEIQSVEAHGVYENDEFDVSFGSETRIIHKPNMRAERGELFAVYSVAKFVGGGFHCDVMRADEVRQNTGYLKAKKANDKWGTPSPWLDHFDEMAKKTVLRRACKYYPMSIELAMALQTEDEQVAQEVVAPSAEQPEVMQNGEVIQLDPPAVQTSPQGQDEPPLFDEDEDEDRMQKASAAAREQIQAMTDGMRKRK